MGRGRWKACFGSTGAPTTAPTTLGRLPWQRASPCPATLPLGPLPLPPLSRFTNKGPPLPPSRSGSFRIACSSISNFPVA